MDDWAKLFCMKSSVKQCNDSRPAVMNQYTFEKEFVRMIACAPI